jgi:hypothetical protein
VASPRRGGFPAGALLPLLQFDDADLAEHGAIVLLEETHRLQRLVGEAREAEDVALWELERAVAGDVDAEKW